MKKEIDLNKQQIFEKFDQVKKGKVNLNFLCEKQINKK